MDWNDVELLDTVVQRAAKLGFKISRTNYGYSGKTLVGVFPLEDHNPLYCRNAELFTGTMEEIMIWFRGIEHRNDYLRMLKATSDRRIRTLEEKYIKKEKQKAMLEKISDPDKKISKHTEDLIKMRNK
jgi:hypothetical protein